MLDDDDDDVMRPQIESKPIMSIQVLEIELQLSLKYK
jgi:hypothetical protein